MALLYKVTVTVAWTFWYSLGKVWVTDWIIIGIWMATMRLLFHLTEIRLLFRWAPDTVVTYGLQEVVKEKL